MLYLVFASVYFIFIHTSSHNLSTRPRRAYDEETENRSRINTRDAHESWPEAFIAIDKYLNRWIARIFSIGDEGGIRKRER